MGTLADSVAARVPRSRALRLPLDTTLRAAALAAIVAVAAALRFANLAVLGYVNHYYAAAVTSMLRSWHNFFFVAAEPGGAVSVDKPPVGLWLQTLSARIFGVNTFGLLLPELLAGILSVIVVYHLVRRWFGTAAGLLAALVLAITPVSVATDRNNTIDSVLILTLLLAAWAFIRATESGRLRHLLLATTLVGIAFNIKMLEAFLPLPAFYALYFFGAKDRLAPKIGKLALATLVLAVVSLSWAMAVDLTPPEQRPYVGSSSQNSVIDLAFGYNGAERLVGMRGSFTGWWATITGANRNRRGGMGVPQRGALPPGFGFPQQGAQQGAQRGFGAPQAGQGAAPQAGGSNSRRGVPNESNGLQRFTQPYGGAGSQRFTQPNGGNRFQPPAQSNGGGMGGFQLPAPGNGAAQGAQGGGIPGFLGGLMGSSGAGGTRGGFGGFGFGGMGGTGRAGPLRLFVPPLSKEASWLLPLGLVAAALLLFRARPRWPVEQPHQAVLLWGGWALTAGVFFSVAGFFHEYYLSILAPAVAALTGIGIVEIWRVGERRRWLAVPLLLVAAAATLWLQGRTVQAFVSTAWWLPVAILLLALGATISIVTAGLHWRPGMLTGVVCVVAALLLAPAIWAGLTTANSSANQSLPAAYGGRPSGPPNRGGLAVNQALLSYVEPRTQGMEYLMAVPSSMQGADYVLATGRPVLYLGGFMGQDRVETSESLSQLVADGRLRFVYWDGRGRMDQQTDITSWVTGHCSAVQGFDAATANSGAPDGTNAGGQRGGMGFRGGMQVTLYDCQAQQAAAR